MSDYMLTLFETTLGRCGLAWGEAGLRSVSFPEADDEATLAQLRRRAPGAVERAPTDEMGRIIDDIVALFNGEKRDLSYARLDLDGIGAFERGVYGLSVKITPGQLKTYGDLARALGDVSFSRRVGADGAMTGFSAPGGAVLKRMLLKIEGALEPELFDAI